jgi:hypothetical protein
MSKLTYLTIPTWSPPKHNRWRLRENWPDGHQAVCVSPLLLFDDKSEAQCWADAANRCSNPEGIFYDVMLATP